MVSIHAPLKARQEQVKLFAVIVCAFYAGVAIRALEVPRAGAVSVVVFTIEPPEYVPRSYPPPAPALPELEAPDFLPDYWAPRPVAEANMLKCLKPVTRALFDEIERRFGPVEVISTCNHSLYVAGTRRVSLHISGLAVDFLAGDRKAKILEWLIATHQNGGTMTYMGSDHIHVDVGRHFVILAPTTYRLANGRQRPRQARTNERRPRVTRAAYREREDSF